MSVWSFLQLMWCYGELSAFRVLCRMNVMFMLVISFSLQDPPGVFFMFADAALHLAFSSLVCSSMLHLHLLYTYFKSLSMCCTPFLCYLKSGFISSYKSAFFIWLLASCLLLWSLQGQTCASSLNSLSYVTFCASTLQSFYCCTRLLYTMCQISTSCYIQWLLTTINVKNVAVPYKEK